MSAEFTTLETRLVSLIEADSYFNGITVLPTSKGDTAAAIDQVQGAVSGDNTSALVGVCVLVGVTGASKPQGIPLEVETDITVAILELPEINNTGKVALDIVPRLIRAVYGQLVTSSALRGVQDKIGVRNPVFERVNDPAGELYGIPGATIYHVYLSARQVLRGS